MTNRTALNLWFGGAFAAFVDGFIDGCPIGGPAGAAMAVADGKVSANLEPMNVLATGAHIFAVPVFSGIADVKAWKKDNPFPNIFGPTSDVIPTPAPASLVTPQT